jgi:hypothetical protein
MQPSNIGSPTSFYGEFKIENMKNKWFWGTLIVRFWKQKKLKITRLLYYVSVDSQKI